ncbi:MAG TPA: fused MFS/spermidine synthase [Bryobacteraceae bacterium]|nr:fused MFS/spermidine synthase [Bryobacteraceae bacterium]
MKGPTISTPSLSVSESLESPPISSGVRVPAAFFAATILLSAFLLFQVQPLIAKLILPWFGGSAAVWTSCMLFFQMALLGGYAYAHWLTNQPGSRQSIIHIGLLALSFLSLPILPHDWWKPTGPEDPLLRILGLLTATVGLPYFLLSSTSPLLQSWYSRANGGAMPYRFFALSNAGSMAGLLAYPVLVEPNLTSGQQAWTWSIAYGFFALVCATVAFRSRKAHLETASVAVETGPAPTLGERLLWMGLAACASALLLAVTNHLTQNVAAIPFLWVLPLSLYLLSFILCFDSDRWYKRWIYARLAAVALPGLAYAISEESTISELKLAVGFFCASLFILFMVCHGELARRRPAPAYLTSFYLMVSVGGAIGGLFIGFAAPYFFNGLYDLAVVVSLTGFVLLYLLWRERAAKIPDSSSKFLDAPFDRPVVLTLVAGLFGYVAWRLAEARFLHGSSFLNGRHDTTVLLGLTGALAVYLLWRTRDSLDDNLIIFAIAAGLAFGITGFLARNTWKAIGHARVLARNFYGALVVYDSETDGSMGPVRVLRHGTIDHGEQFLWPQNRRFPTTYYAKKSGVGLAIQTLQMQGPMRVGVIGLGAGTLASYARPIDYYRIYDINPLVLRIAETQFTYLKDCLVPHDVVLGDARLSLDREPTQKFDALVVDAFSGDAIPVHLLTREAFRLYWRHLKPDGVLAVHVSNRYLTLAPVVAMGAAEDGKTAKIVNFETDERNETEETDSDWVLVSSRPGFFDQPEIKVAHNIDPIAGLRMWTDDYSNLYRILR